MAGIINIIPSILAFIPSKISEAYGVEIPNVNFELLLRHRAILFGIIGGLLIHAAITKQNYNTATIIGFISMFSFVLLFILMNGNVNPELYKVLKIDIAGILILALGFVQYKYR